MPPAKAKSLRDQAVGLLRNGWSVRQVAKQVGLPSSTIGLWRQQEGVGKEAETARWVPRRRPQPTADVQDMPEDVTQDVLRRYQMPDAQVVKLARSLTQIALAAYLEGVNGQLTALGLPPVGRVTDPDVLDEVRQDAQQVAEDVRATYARDLQRVVQEGGDAGNAKALEQHVDRWTHARAESRSEMVAQTEAHKWANRGACDFAMRNADNLNVSAVFVPPGGCGCADCCNLVAGNPYSADDLPELREGLPAHPGCRHTAHPRARLTGSPQDLWRAQAVG